MFINLKPTQINRYLNSFERIADSLEKIASNLNGPVLTQATRIVFFMEMPTGEKRKVENVIQKITQLLKLSLEILDAKGNAAAVDGAPKWTVSDQSLGELKVSEDGMSAEFTPLGPLGTCKIQVLADADLGAGQKDLIGEMEVTLVGAEAVSLALKGVLSDIVVPEPVPEEPVEA